MSIFLIVNVLSTIEISTVINKFLIIVSVEIVELEFIPMYK